MSTCGVSFARLMCMYIITFKTRHKVDGIFKAALVYDHFNLIFVMMLSSYNKERPSLKTKLLELENWKETKRKKKSLREWVCKKESKGNNFFCVVGAVVVDLAHTGCRKRRRWMKLFPVVLFPSGGPGLLLWGAVGTPRLCSVTAMLLLFLSLLWPSLSLGSPDILPPSWLNYIYMNIVLYAFPFMQSN